MEVSITAKHARFSTGLLSRQFQPPRMYDLPNVEQQNAVCFCTETGFELGCAEVKTKVINFSYLFIIIRDFLACMVLSWYSKPVLNSLLCTILQIDLT